MRQVLLTAIWHEIEEFPGYVIDDHGRVMNEWTKRVLAPRTNLQDFLIINMVRDRAVLTRSVALLVAKTFLEPPPNPSYNSIIHLNGDRLDCRASNLMWRPRWYAIRYHKMFYEDPARIKVYIPNTGEVFHSLREACTTYGLVERNTYLNLINREPCFHYGWIFERFGE